MDRRLKLEDLIQELEREEENIEKQKLSLKKDGILDEGLDFYLTDSINLIKERKEKLIKDFYPQKTDKKIRKNSPSTMHLDTKLFDNNIFESNHRPLVSNKPLYSVHNIEKKILSPPAAEIFRKKVSPERGNSPSAIRYSPQLSPSSVISEKVKNLEALSGHESPPCSTRSSASSIDKLVCQSTGNFDPQSYELYRKYQEKREIRNRAHEDMLRLKEQILIQKEKKLEELLKTIMIRGNNVGDIDFYDKKDTRNRKFNTECGSPKYVKPPRSPKPMKTTDFKEETTNSEFSCNDKIVRDI
ncbi:hypothetical protein SteCoe_11038 [Stentor coeruleus]|uniref:Uncharacterized protein n=1 Tax=Stentor coeruleus TaxID=5963 RepID=A0A1R2CE73_9CILI|nr:hypothetical protein SteCoe_11038 [Stentor coeruleus]